MAAAVTLTDAPKRAPLTLFGAMAAVAREAAAYSEAIVWPSPRWRDDPRGFAREVLDTELWDKQVELVEAIRDNRNTTCRSGHKCGKTTALAVAALWFYASFDEARVLMTAVKAAQVDEAMWREVKRLYRRAKKNGYDLGGVLGEKASYGLRSSEDGRQIFGLTSREAEGNAGISGANVLILIDEASGVHDKFFEVLGTSLAGSGGVVRKCYISNPTRTTGEFYRSHTVNKALFKCVHINSEDTPNARGTGTFPGLAGPEWIAERKTEWGEDSHAYNVRVKGNFVHDRDGKIISLDLIALAQQAWDEAPEEGTLQIGVDPAGDGVAGDESAFAVRRGPKIVTVQAERGLSEDEIVERVSGLVKTYRRPGEPAPRVAIDCEGGIGTRVFEKLRAYADRHRGPFEVVEVRSGKKLWGSPEFDTIRDGLWGQAAKWIEAGGAIPDDVKLAQELNAPIFVADENRRYRATPKKILKKELGRSPDRADAVCLAIWGFEEEATNDDDGPDAELERVSTRDDADEVYDAPSDLSPYGGSF